MEGSQAVHFGGFDFRSGIGEETLSSPSPLSSGVYTKGQLQVLASLELLHVLRKGGDQVAAFGGGGTRKTKPLGVFRGFSWVLLSLVFVGFRGFSWVFVGFRGFSWVLLFSPFVVCCLHRIYVHSIFIRRQNSLVVMSKIDNFKLTGRRL